MLDRGLRWGDAVYDAARTFDGRLFKLEDHLERFFRSLRYARIDPRLDKPAVKAICEEVVRRNEAARQAPCAAEHSGDLPPALDEDRACQKVDSAEPADRRSPLRSTWG